MSKYALGFKKTNRRCDIAKFHSILRRQKYSHCDERSDEVAPNSMSSVLWRHRIHKRVDTVCHSVPRHGIHGYRIKFGMTGKSLRGSTRFIDEVLCHRYQLKYHLYRSPALVGLSICTAVTIG